MRREAEGVSETILDLPIFGFENKSTTLTKDFDASDELLRSKNL